MLISFSLHAADYYKITQRHNGPSICGDIGDIVNPDSVASCLDGNSIFGLRISDPVFSPSSRCVKARIHNDKPSCLIYLQPTSSCPSGTSKNPSTGKCEVPNPVCETLSGQDAPSPQSPIPKDGKPITATRLSCNTSNYCEVANGYSASGGSLVKDSFYTGNNCSGYQEGGDNSALDNQYEQCSYYGGCGSGDAEEPQPPWEGCKKPFESSDYVCKKDTDGDGRPNNEQEEYDDAAYCNHGDDGSFSCSGGSFDDQPDNGDGDNGNGDNGNGDNGNGGGGNIPGNGGDSATITPPTDSDNDPIGGDETDPVTDVPDATTPADGKAYTAVVNLDNHMQQSISGLNADINTQANKSQRIGNTLIKNTDAVNKNLIRQTEADKKNTDKLGEKLDTLNDSLNGISGKIDGLNNGGAGGSDSGLGEKIEGLGEKLDKIDGTLTGVDASGAGVSGTCIETDTCTGFYESAYEGDLSGIIGDGLTDMKSSVVDPFVESFGNIDLSGAKRPNFGIPVPFYGYFSFEDFIDLDWVFGFIRFVFLASTAFYCRQIIFGG